MFVRHVYLFLTFKMANTRFESNVNLPQIRLHLEDEVTPYDIENLEKLTFRVCFINL